MDAAQPCPICTHRREANNQPARVPNRPQVCDACRGIIASQLAAIPGLGRSLIAPDYPPPRSWVRDTTGAERNTHRYAPAQRAVRPDIGGVLHIVDQVDDDAVEAFAAAIPPPGPALVVDSGQCRCGLPRSAHRRTGMRVTIQPDPVYAILPAGPTKPARLDASVSGSRDAPVPVDLDVVDLTGHARYRIVDRSAVVAAGLSQQGRMWLDDQIGHLPVVAVLDQWVVDLVAHRGCGERRPDATAAAMCRWLGDRLDDACDDHPDIAAFASDIGDLYSALRAAAGLVDVPEYVDGVRCPSCSVLNLWRINGSEFVECGSCERLVSPAEFAHWVFGEVLEVVDFIAAMIAVCLVWRDRVARRAAGSPPLAG